ncbi:hypothetical protein KP509_38G013600 [Ceratopteris richardii]|uniref:Uncharacterized protein n=1 Tax=Ceratopteris richardii TaxID=49495 RepID=A0A8T2Q2J0_CERRI|nr:hypothetical protein KP509_38G013600 [Ceratopteris richardii]
MPTELYASAPWHKGTGTLQYSTLDAYIFDTCI